MHILHIPPHLGGVGSSQRGLGEAMLQLPNHRSCCWACRGFTAAHGLVTQVGTQIHSLLVTVIVDEEEPVGVRECYLALGFLVLDVIRRKYLIRVVHAVDIRFYVFRDVSRCSSR